MPPPDPLALSPVDVVREAEGVAKQEGRTKTEVSARRGAAMARASLGALQRYGAGRARKLGMTDGRRPRTVQEFRRAGRCAHCRRRKSPCPRSSRPSSNSASPGRSSTRRGVLIRKFRCSTPRARERCRPSCALAAEPSAIVTGDHTCSSSGGFAGFKSRHATSWGAQTDDSAVTGARLTRKILAA